MRVKGIIGSFFCALNPNELILMFVGQHYTVWLLIQLCGIATYGYIPFTTWYLYTWVQSRLSYSKLCICFGTIYTNVIALFYYVVLIMEKNEQNRLQSFVICVFLQKLKKNRNGNFYKQIPSVCERNYLNLLNSRRGHPHITFQAQKKLFLDPLCFFFVSHPHIPFVCIFNKCGQPRSISIGYCFRKYSREAQNGIKSHGIFVFQSSLLGIILFLSLEIIFFSIKSLGFLIDTNVGN